MLHADLQQSRLEKNHLFAEQYRYTGRFRHATQIRLIRYNASRMDIRDVPPETQDFAALVHRQCINWFEVTGLTDAENITRLVRQFGIHPLEIRAILTPNHAAKIADCEDHLLIVMGSCSFVNKKRIISEHNCILLKENIVLTFKEWDNSSFEHVIENLRTNLMDVREEESGLLVAFIINTILSEMIGTAIRVEQMLEKLDDALLSLQSENLNFGRRIQQCRHANLIIQKNSRPLRDEFDKLLTVRSIRNQSMTREIYNELSSQLDFIVLTAENSKEILASLRDMYASYNDLRTNAIMKRLTVVSTLFIPITFLVGLWGMNFRIMPETGWKYGYLFAWAMLALTAGLTWYYMRKNKWF